jgi:hypothetical protein
MLREKQGGRTFHETQFAATHSSNHAMERTADRRALHF